MVRCHFFSSTPPPAILSQVRFSTVGCMLQHCRVRVRGAHGREIATVHAVVGKERARRGRAHERCGAVHRRRQRGLVHAVNVPLHEELLPLQLQLRVHGRVVDVRTQRQLDDDDDVFGNDEENETRKQGKVLAEEGAAGELLSKEK